MSRIAMIVWLLFLLLQVASIYRLNRECAGTDDFGTGMLLVLLVALCIVLDFIGVVYYFVSWIRG